jgi:hypothetical protein
LFNLKDFSNFNFACLTPDDCDKLRCSIISKFQISGCPCKRLSCYDMSNLCPTRSQRRKPYETSEDKSIGPKSLKDAVKHDIGIALGITPDKIQCVLLQPF